MVVPLPRDPRAALVDPVVVREPFDAGVEALQGERYGAQG